MQVSKFIFTLTTAIGLTSATLVAKPDESAKRDVPAPQLYSGTKNMVDNNNRGDNLPQIYKEPKNIVKREQEKEYLPLIYKESKNIVKA
ncbi:hypothetical protein F5Y08DRAFT_345760 [Xylaria arbuscula]|nr:hypothetical protein F5Y08DRAFT_345760 [Xylaria arbuscula]